MTSPGCSFATSSTEVGITKPCEARDRLQRLLQVEQHIVVPTRVMMRISFDVPSVKPMLACDLSKPVDADREARVRGPR